MLSTKIRTLKREEVTIPNPALVGAAMKNFSRQVGKKCIILHATVPIGYSAPWRRVHRRPRMTADWVTAVVR